MKTIEQTLAIIDVKVKEHTKIMDEIKKDLEQSRQKMAEMATLAPGDKAVLFTQSNLLMVLKDRIMFHKACVLQLNDLVKEINE